MLINGVLFLIVTVVPTEDRIWMDNTNAAGVCDYMMTYRSASIDTSLGDVIFEMDVETPTNDCQLLGVEFDGTYFYITGGASGADTNKVYVIDTIGNLVLTLDQPEHVDDYWGWRDLAWDGVYTGLDRIDTLYASFNRYVDKFGINFQDTSLEYYGAFTGPGLPVNRALAYNIDSAWFYTGNAVDSCYKFSKKDSSLQSVDNSYYMYGAARDNDILSGEHIWWHSQDSTASKFYCLIEQMDAVSMNFTGVIFDYTPTIINSGIAGGLCYYDNFRGMDVLFALVQGDPVDIIAGIFVRHYSPGIDGGENTEEIKTSDLIACVPNPTKGRTSISYVTSEKGRVLLQIYDKTGCLVKTLVDGEATVGCKTVCWNGDDNQHKRLPSGVYFVEFATREHRETKKIILLH
jgi:hypothetical protein